MKTSELPIGFTSMPNKRILAAIAATALRLLAAGLKPKEAEAEAVRIVARSLPPEPFRRQLRSPRPSRSDDPAYRKPIPA